MSRHRWSLALLVPVICGLGSGCVVFGGLSVQQTDVIGDLRWTITPCASGVVPGSCADTGTSTWVAQPGPCRTR
jgi:hypothetical protein